MTQRNPMNQRNMGDGPKGSSRKSAASATPKRKAADSVTIPSEDAKAKRKRAAAKEKAKQQQYRERQYADMMSSQAKRQAEYKRWRMYWVLSIVIAVVMFAMSYFVRPLSENGIAPAIVADNVGTVSMVVLGIGYAALIAALIIDMVKIRPIRKAEAEKAQNLSKKQRAELDKQIEERDAQKASKGGLRMPWSKE